MGCLRLVLVILLFVSLASCDSQYDNFMQCMSKQLGANSSKIIQTSNSPSYSNLYQSFLQNPRVVNSKTPKPLLIVTPFLESQIQVTVLCSTENGLQIRVRSGGHDYEGQSYISISPFVVLELGNLRSIEVNVQDESAWVQSGATLGEVYYNIAKKSNVHGFPGGTCPTVGVGGHISGGGFGTLVRKYGLAADNVLDAHLVDVKGRLLNRKSMGENVFWAIRGGGGASYGIITSWKIKLVRVPPVVTGFTVTKKIEEGAGKLVHRWQLIADKLPQDLLTRLIIQNGALWNERTVQVLFNSLFLGNAKSLITLMNANFPELGLQPQDCVEMSWIQSVLYFGGFKQSDPLEVLLNRNYTDRSYFKAKSDFVKEPLPENALAGIYDRLFQGEKSLNQLIMEPFGGRMNEIPEIAIPFPHRKGNMYNIQYIVKWQTEGVSTLNKHMQWIRSLYEYMKPYVSKNPRGAYINYKDYDLGVNKGNTSFTEASVWGTKYFKGNFKRLAQAKNEIDPLNFFRNEQSIPPLHASGKGSAIKKL